MRAIPPLAVEFIGEHEALRLTAYDDLQPKKRVFASVAEVKGRATIGYGHTETVTAQDVVNRRRITDDEAKVLLGRDLADARRRLYGKVSADVIDSLTTNQYVALLSFVFNLGAGNWTIWRKLNARQYDQVPAQMARFVNAGGKKLQGLVNRRAAETALWSTAEPGSRDMTPPSSVTRAIDTPPTPERQPSAKPEIATQIGQGVAGTAIAATAIKDQLEPAALYSDKVAGIVAFLAILVALMGVVGLVLAWRRKRAAKQ